MDENSLMPFGKHKGKRMIDVPDSYLEWLYDEGTYGDLLEYLEDNIDFIRANAVTERNKNKYYNRE